MAKKSELSIRLETNKEFLEEFKNYYLTHSLNETAEHFNISCSMVMKCVSIYHLKKRKSEITLSLRIKENESLKEDIANFYTNHSAEETAQAFNCSKREINYFLRKYNITTHRSCNIIRLAKKDKTILDSIVLYYSTHSLSETAKYFKCSLESLISLFKQFNIASHDKAFVQKKRQETWIRKYGVSSPTKSVEVKNKIAKTNLERYGASTPFLMDSFWEKAKKTCQDKYGTDFALQSKEIREKGKQTCLEKYGFEYSSQAPEIKEKTNKTFQERYKAHHASSIYFYNNLKFDSFPELCFYLYYLKNNFDIHREAIYFTFSFDGRSYNYFPDFKINEKLYELKGDHFLKEDGTWQNPFNHLEDAFMEAKRQCALNNGVIILYSKDYQKYIDWFYSQGYLKENFK